MKKSATVTRVTATQILKRNGELAGYRYAAELADGTEEVVREKATRLYANAFRFNFTDSQKDVSAWAFGKKPPAIDELPSFTYPIQVTGE